jgi:protein-tyrosine phosphatase
MSEFKLLFVCMGNICRSPAAEAVMKEIVEREGLDERIHIDSAGTLGLHEGNRADPRMRAAGSDRGYDLTSIARQVRRGDFEEFDLIVVMDDQNLADIRPFQPKTTAAHQLRLFCEFCTEHDHTEVPDPYYGGPEGFEDVLDLLEDGCEGLLKHIRAAITPER